MFVYLLYLFRKAFLQYRFSVYLCIYLCIWVFDWCKPDLIIYLPKNSRNEIYIHLYHVFSDNEVLVFKWSSHSKYRHNARHQQLRGLKTWPRCRVPSSEYLELWPGLLLGVLSLEVPLPGNDGLLPLPELEETGSWNTTQEYVRVLL